MTGKLRIMGWEQMTGRVRVTGEEMEDPGIVKMNQVVMMMKWKQGKETMVGAIFTTLEDMADDTSQENIRSIMCPGKSLGTPGMKTSLLLSSCALS